MKKSAVGKLFLSACLAMTFTTHAFASTSEDYIVKKGDTLSGIALKTKISITTLESLNHLKNDTIYVGQHLILHPTNATSNSNNKSSSSVKSGSNTKQSSKTTSSSPTSYIVQKGDTLSQIAVKTKVSVSALKSLNHLSSDTISVGQHLLLRSTSSSPSTGLSTPAIKQTYDTYIVKSGDSLSVIAQKYHMTVSDLQSLNHLKNTTITIGEKLLVNHLASTPSKGQTSSSTSSIRKEIVGFTVRYGSTDTTSLESVQGHHQDLTSIVTATHTVNGMGNINGKVPIDQLKEAKKDKLSSLLMVGNDFNQSAAHTLLGNAGNRKAFVKNLLTILKANGYTGVNIDLENLLPSDRDNYTTFLKELSQSLKPLNYQLTVSLPAKTEDYSYEFWNYAYNYQAIAPYVDKAVIMTYDEHYIGGDSGSIASIGWVQNVLNYTLTAFPKNKILIGIATYGYDWGASGSAKSYSYNQVMNLAQQVHAKIQFDGVTKTPYFTYQDSQSNQHIVWFENAQSFGYKMKLVKDKGVEGIAIWRLGIEDSQMWKAIEDNF